MQGTPRGTIKSWLDQKFRGIRVYQYGLLEFYLQKLLRKWLDGMPMKDGAQVRYIFKQHFGEQPRKTCLAFSKLRGELPDRALNGCRLWLVEEESIEHLQWKCILAASTLEVWVFVCNEGVKCNYNYTIFLERKKVVPTSLKTENQRNYRNLKTLKLNKSSKCLSKLLKSYK